MAYEFMFSTAMDIIQKKKEAGEFISSDDTVCVIYSRSGKIYTGSSRTGNYMNPLGGVHAEIEAVRNMQTFNDTAIEAIMLVHIYSNGLILPCTNCLNYIVNLNSNNYRAVIVVGDRLIPVSEIVNFQSPGTGGAVNTVSIHTSDLKGNLPRNIIPNNIMRGQSENRAKDSSSGNYLKNKVNDLMSVAEDEHEETEEKENKGKKLFGGLFGRH
ncbi:MAG: hypothetical protein KBA55_11235 [Ruminococcus sp.]|nr:hypothetical protein [Ruminococcus sp.]